MKKTKVNTGLKIKIIEQKGITLAALVITILILIILMSITINLLTGDDNLIGRTKKEVEEYEKESLLQTVKLAKTYLEVEDDNSGINISKLVDEVEDLLSSELDDYIISKDEENQTATIIHKDTGVLINIWKDEKDNINVEGEIVDDIEDVSKPTITYALNPPLGTLGEKVEITITAKEENKGIAKIEFQGNVETVNNEKEITRKYTVTNNGTYKVTVEGTNGRRSTINIEVYNIIKTDNVIVLQAQNTKPTNKNVSVKIVYDKNIEKALSNKDRFQYSIGENNWKTSQNTEITIEVETNEMVYARYYDGNQGYNTTSIAIQNIDKEKPIISSAKASTSWSDTNSVTITATDTGTIGCAKNNIGIVGYGINQSSTTEPTYTTVAATTSLNAKISNITANGTYYVWVKDQAGNTANVEVTVNKIDKTSPTTATINSSNIADTTFTLTATGADGESGIAKYEFYINDALSTTVTTNSGTATYNVTGMQASSSYTCKVRVYDNAGNYKDSNTITVTTTAACNQYR